MLRNIALSIILLNFFIPQELGAQHFGGGLRHQPNLSQSLGANVTEQWSFKERIANALPSILILGGVGMANIAFHGRNNYRLHNNNILLEPLIPEFHTHLSTYILCPLFALTSFFYCFRENNRFFPFTSVAPARPTDIENLHSDIARTTNSPMNQAVSAAFGAATLVAGFVPFMQHQCWSSNRTNMSNRLPCLFGVGIMHTGGRSMLAVFNSLVALDYFPNLIPKFSSNHILSHCAIFNLINTASGVYHASWKMDGNITNSLFTNGKPNLAFVGLEMLCNIFYWGGDFWMNPAFKFFAREAFGYPETNPPHTPLVAPFFSNALPGFIEIAYICLVVHRFQFFLYQDNNTSSDAWQKSLNSCLNYQLWKVFPAHSIATIIYVMTATKLVARGYPGHWVVYNVPLWTRLLGSLYKRPHLGNPPPWPFH